MKGKEVERDTMTENDHTEWREFKREMREDIRGIHTKMSEVSSSISVIATKLERKIEKPDMQDFVDKMVYRHKRDCTDITGVKDVTKSQDRTESATSAFVVSPLIIKLGIGIGSAIAGFVAASEMFK